MSTTYFGLAISDSMFPHDCSLIKRNIEPITVRDLLIERADVQFCLNLSHVATINAAREKYNLAISVPLEPPKVILNNGDSIIVMSVQGFPRLPNRRDYTQAEIAEASFHFSIYRVKE